MAYLSVYLPTCLPAHTVLLHSLHVSGVTCIELSIVSKLVMCFGGVAVRGTPEILFQSDTFRI